MAFDKIKIPAGAIDKGRFARSIKNINAFLVFMSKPCHWLKYVASEIVKLYKTIFVIKELLEIFHLPHFLDILRNDTPEMFLKPHNTCTEQQ